MTRAVNDDATELSSPVRLADLEASGLLRSSIAALDALTVAACTSLGPGTTAAVTALSDHEQVMVSAATATDSAAARLPAGTSRPLSHSLCTHVVGSGEPYVVVDASEDPRHALVHRDLGIGAYAGFPLRGARGTVLGAVCAFTPGPRQWSTFDLGVLGSLATAASSVVAMHTATRQERRARITGAVPVEPLARIHHDLRTPLTSLFGFLDLMLDGAVGDFTPAQLDALRRCHTSAGRLLDAVDDLH